MVTPGPHPAAGAGTPSPPVRVFLLDDHEVVRRGVTEMLDRAGGFVVVGEAASAAAALPRIAATRPDVAVLDARLGDGDGIAVCAAVRDSLPAVRCGA